MTFDKKKWLDEHVVPLLKDTSLQIYHPFWNGDDPREILVLLLSTMGGNDDVNVDDWAKDAKALIDQGWRFDFAREQVPVKVEDKEFLLFGGDGSPIFSQEGTASIRLIKKQDGVLLILQVAVKAGSVEQASLAIKTFYKLFEENPLELVQKYGAPFGLA